MKIVLLGYMGCGKSAVSKLLSKSLNLKNIDLDDYIENKAGKTIANVFKDHGEIYFRKLETSCLLELLDSSDDFILSLGGGTPCFGNNIEVIKQKSIAVYLSATIPTLVHRLLPEKDKRPLIARIEDANLPEFIGKHLFERRQFYLQAQHTVMVDDKEVKQIVSEIVAVI